MKCGRKDLLVGPKLGYFDKCLAAMQLKIRILVFKLPIKDIQSTIFLGGTKNKFVKKKMV